MSRNWINYLLDVLLVLLGIALVFTGLLLEWVMPGGRGGGASLWGFGRHDWGEVHFWIALALIAVVLVHLLMHWGWVATMTRRLVAPGRGGAVSAGWRFVTATLTVALLAALVGGSLAWVNTQVVRAAPRDASAGATTRPAAISGDHDEHDEHAPRGDGRGRGLGNGPGRGMAREARDH
jgi:hypothetical protein